MIHHIPDLEAAARELRRVLRPGAPVLIRQGYPGLAGPTRTFPWEFFPETARMTDTFPTLEQTCQAFDTAGFRRDALEPVPEILISLPEFLIRADSFRRSDTIMRNLTEEEFARGKEQLRLAVQHAAETGGQATRTNGSTSWSCAERCLRPGPSGLSGYVQRFFRIANYLARHGRIPGSASSRLPS